MKEIIADLQIHSKYSRATSKNLSFENLEKYARIKGLNLLGVGDFQHPLHFKEINEKLREDDNGILWTKTEFPFLWQTEISLMYSQDGKRRAVHLLVFAPNKEVAYQIIEVLSKRGRLDYDGRPIFGITCPEFVEIMKEISEEIEIIPAHAWTPWFGIFGSVSGFNSLKEAFNEKANKVYAIETGISSSPDMNWRIKELHEKSIVSFSDSHSFWPWRIGREATIFECELSYENIVKAIRTGQGLKATVETPPEYGKYHYDGHRNCNFSCSPEETKRLEGICPKCGRALIIGVENRIEELASENKGYMPRNAKPFYKLTPLHELVAFVLNTQLSSVKCWNVYNELIENFGSEFNILLNVSKEELLRKKIDNKLVELIVKNREGKLNIKPGYDGEYGKIVEVEPQKKLF